MEQIKLMNGMSVSKDAYITAKTKDLIEWGYGSLTEEVVRAQVDKILSGDTELDIIGHFCKGDFYTKAEGA
jgi:hypothetical protein